MVMTEVGKFVINPLDESTHDDKTQSNEVHFQHGKTKIKNNSISIAFVFRVSLHICLCKKEDNTVILPKNIIEMIKSKEMNSKVTQADRLTEYK